MDDWVADLLCLSFLIPPAILLVVLISSRLEASERLRNARAAMKTWFRSSEESCPLQFFCSRYFDWLTR